MKDISVTSIDKTDLKRIDLMISNNLHNKQISSMLGIPLSTTQRRVRRIMEKELVVSEVHLNYEKIGFKTGLVHVYLTDGNIDEIMEKCLNLKESSQLRYIYAIQTCWRE